MRARVFVGSKKVSASVKKKRSNLKTIVNAHSHILCTHRLATRNKQKRLLGVRESKSARNKNTRALTIAETSERMFFSLHQFFFVSFAYVRFLFVSATVAVAATAATAISTVLAYRRNGKNARNMGARARARERRTRFNAAHAQR